MPIRQLSTKAGLGASLILVVIALFVTSLLALVLPFTPHVIFVGAITLSVLLGGIKAGLLRLLGTVVAINYFFITPLYALTLGGDDLGRLGLFAIALLVAVLQRKTFVGAKDVAKTMQR